MLKIRSEYTVTTNYLNTPVLFGLGCKQWSFPRVVSNGNTLEMSIFVEMKGVNCATLVVQTLKSLLN